MRGIDLTGQRFGRLTVVAFVERNARGIAKWLCRCDCATEKIVWGNSLRSGNSKSCGCLQKEVSTQLATKHGMSKKPEYVSWHDMITRCTYPKHAEWKHYGGAKEPVTVCDRWRDPEHGFENFYADMGPRPAGTTLGRFLDMGNYEPTNCKWMTKAEQVEEQRKKRQLLLGKAA